MEEDVFYEIQQELVNYYKADTSWINSVPWTQNSGSMTQSNWFDLSIMTKDLKTGIVKEERGCATDIFVSHCPLQRIVVLGDPGFGKTTLFSKLARDWSYNDPSINFSLCIKYNLKDNQMESLEDAIVEYCKGLLSKCNYQCEKSTIKAALKLCTKYTGSSLLLLDDFDQLSEYGQDAFYQFLQYSIFRKSMIVISCRYGLSQEMSFMFNRFVKINGLSELRLKEFKKFHPEVVITNINKLLLRLLIPTSFTYLSEMSPFLQYYMVDAIKHGMLQKKNLKIFDILEKTMEQFVIHNRQKLQIVIAKDMPMVFQKVGELFYNALIADRFTFEENNLKKWLCKGFDFIVQAGILHFQQVTKENVKLWSVSSKLFMIFFATNYLHIEWSKLGTDLKRTKFLKKHLCLGDLSGDYIMNEELGIPNLYFVGVLPEIVLNYGRGNSLKSAEIDMFYDVGRIEHSHAFDSINLLVRISERYLKRFHFVNKTVEANSSDISDLQNVFRLYMDELSFNDCYMKHDFYINTFENKHFLKVYVRNSNLSGDNILVTVLQANVDKQIEKVYLEIQFSQMSTVRHLLIAILNNNFPGIALTGNCWNLPFGEFLCTLVCAIGNCIQNRQVLFHCSNRTEQQPFELNKTIWSILIKPKDSNTNSGVYISHYDIYPGENRMEKKFCERDWLLNHRVEFGSHISLICQNICSPTLRLYIF